EIDCARYQALPGLNGRCRARTTRGFDSQFNGYLLIGSAIQFEIKSECCIVAIKDPTNMLNVDFRYELKPYRLPYTGGALVPDSIWLFCPGLFAPGLFSINRVVENPQDQSWTI